MAYTYVSTDLQYACHLLFLYAEAYRIMLQWRNGEIDKSLTLDVISYHTTLQRRKGEVIS